MREFNSQSRQKKPLSRLVEIICNTDTTSPLVRMPWTDDKANFKLLEPLSSDCCHVRESNESDFNSKKLDADIQE
jgi:hypothetical protein